MPCDSGPRTYSVGRYYDATCTLLKYALAQIGAVIPQWVDVGWDRLYMPEPSKADADRAASMLCALIRSLSEAERERIVYDAHSAMSRALADWWEDHLETDAHRDRMAALAAPS